jgi:hypothetical protein
MWSRSVYNLCEWGNPVCGGKVAWRLRVATYPEYYCAACAPLVACALGIEAPEERDEQGGADREAEALRRGVHGSGSGERD